MRKIHLFTIIDSYGKAYGFDFDIKDLIAQEKTYSFEIRPVMEHDAKFHPETITYTGVTVGGVHTGGFQHNKAHFTTSGKYTGRSEIIFKREQNYDKISGTIEKIIFTSLTDKNYVKLKKMLSENICFKSDREDTIELRVRSITNASTPESVWKTAISTGNMYMQSALLNQSISEYATTKVCKNVIGFLERTLKGEFLSDEYKCLLVDSLLDMDNPKCWNIAYEIVASISSPKAHEKKELIQARIGKHQQEQLSKFKKKLPVIIPVAAVVLILLFGTTFFFVQRHNTQQLNSDIRRAIDFITSGETIYNKDDYRLEAFEEVKEELLFETKLNEALLELDMLNYLSVAAVHLEHFGYL